MSQTQLRIGFIPLVDAAATIVAVTKGFTRDEGLDVSLVREVSWSNVRDKLNIGLFDAAHLLAPVAIASSLGLAHVKVPTIAPFNLAINGNAITVSPALHAALMTMLEGDATDTVATAKALARVVAERRTKGQEPLTFGMTFPFSAHNYQLRYWMAEGGVDPDEDVRLVVLPPPYMVDSIASGQIDGFCVGAPWNSIAVDHGVGYILHMVSEFVIRAVEKVLAVNALWAEKNPDTVARLVRAHQRAADFITSEHNRDEVLAILSQPEHLGVSSEVLNRTISGRLKISPDGAIRENRHHLLIGTDGVARPDPIQGAWLYAQMVRWGQVPLTQELLDRAMGVFRPDLYDAALGRAGGRTSEAGWVHLFAGPDFDPARIEHYIRGFAISRFGR